MCLWCDDTLPATGGLREYKREKDMNGEWTVVDGVEEGAMDSDEPITDLCLLAKKEKAPPGFTVVKNCLMRPTRMAT